VQHVFASKVDAMVDLIQPKDLYLIAGRGTAKTSSIMAKRSMRIIEDMPHSYQVFLSTTYVDALTNVMPALIEGWLRNGWREGIDYVVDKRPDASHFLKPYKPPMKYKHTISTRHGVFFNIGSLDQPSGLAGNSYQHLYGDEARLLKKGKLDKISPALRGQDARFMHSTFYMGRTFTTDMPNLMLNDDDWILELEKEMDQEQIEAALQAGLILNEIKREMIANEQMANISERARLEKSYKQWLQYWTRIRQDSILFYQASSFHNLDILTNKFFSNTLTALGPEEFKSAILSFKVSINKGERFYYNLSENHFYENGTMTEYYDKYSIKDTITASSEALRFCKTDMPLEAGMDFGNMMSLVICQELGDTFFFLKELHTLAPDNEEHLAEQFRIFFRNHKCKYLIYYYDRSGNNNQQIKKDFASSFKKNVEFKNGVATGWTVQLMSEGQNTIFHNEEQRLSNLMFGGKDSNLPKIQIDAYNCPNLKSSLQLAKTTIKIDSTGSRLIVKDKSSEKKLPLHSLPRFSTNYSDAFKYIICRPKWLEVASAKSSYQGFAPGVY
jgi:hypothetical protein